MKQQFLSSMFAFRQYFDWLPGPVASVFMLLVIGIVTYSLSRLATDALLRFPGRRGGAVIRTVTTGMRRPARLMITILVVYTSLQAAWGLSYDTLSLIAHALLIGFILLLGYSAVIAFRLATEAYLNRLSSRENTDDIMARTHQTQIRVLRRMGEILTGVVTVAIALMTFPSVRNYGVSLFASAGAASLVVGLAARGLLTNLIAGVQIAITQPIRMEDLIIINGDWAWVEEITATYVVLRVWDWRRHIVPISYFLENRFENWTHNSAAIIGVVFLYLDYQAPMDKIREQLQDIIKTCPLWDGKVFDCQVADCTSQIMSIRIIASARNALQSWDLRCEIREKIINRIRAECPEALPRTRLAVVAEAPGGHAWPQPGPQTGLQPGFQEGLQPGQSGDHVSNDMISPPIMRPPPGSYMGPQGGTDPAGPRP